MKLRLVLLAYFGIQLGLKAQDPQFTQFYAAPLYHNPAFTGGSYAPRVIVNYRYQWPGLDANFETTLIGFDHYIDRAKSGVGILLMNDKVGDRYKNNAITGLYSYQMSVSEEAFVRFGLSATYGTKQFDYRNLIFPDQLSNTGNTGQPSQDPFANLGKAKPVGYFDFGGGALYYNSVFHVGASVSHIAHRASQSDTSLDSDMKMVIQAGLTIPLNQSRNLASNYDKKLTLNPVVLYKRQAKFSQLDVGAYVTYTPLTLGLFYRGIPFEKKVSDFTNQDALSGLLGFRYEKFSVGYSYDYTISGLRGITGGTHELSFAYQLDELDKKPRPFYKRRRSETSCPRF